MTKIRETKLNVYIENNASNIPMMNRSICKGKRQKGVENNCKRILFLKLIIIQFLKAISIALQCLEA